MRIVLGYLILTVTVCLAGCVKEDPNRADSTGSLAGEYLGQEPPGLKPLVFASGIVSTNDHRERDVSFTADLDEFYFSRDGAIMVMKRTADRWSEPKTASFSGAYHEFEAFVTQDNQKLYYISRRPLSGGGESEDWQMWFVQRDGEQWSEPSRLTDLGDFYPTVTVNGVMYFTGADNDLYRSRLVDGQMTEREKLGDSVNTEAAEYNACIAPDESFIVFTSHGWGQGFGGGDLFVSFRNENDSWTKAKNLGGGVNTTGLEYCPSISPDGKYLFFARRESGNEDIYWVDADLIEQLRTIDLNFADTLYMTLVEKGVEFFVKQYQEIRRKYSEYRDFDGDLLVGLGDRLFAEKRSGRAAEMIRMAFQFHPESQTIFHRIKLAILEKDRETFDDLTEELKSESNTESSLEPSLNRLGYEMLGLQRFDDALQVFGLNVELFPESANVYDSYGEGLLASGDTTQAVEFYEKSLRLNPENTNASDILNRLRGTDE